MSAFNVAALTALVSSAPRVHIYPGSYFWSIAIFQEPSFGVYLWITKRFSWRKLRRVHHYRLTTDSSSGALLSSDQALLADLHREAWRRHEPETPASKTAVAVRAHYSAFEQVIREQLMRELTANQAAK